MGWMNWKTKKSHDKQRNQNSSKSTEEKDSKKQNISWKITIKYTSRALRLLYEMSPKYMVTNILMNILDAIKPYVGIYYSARIIESLVQGGDSQVLMSLVMQTLVIMLVLNLAHGIISKLNNNERRVSYHRCRKLINDKLLSMDYPNVDNTKYHDLLDNYEQSENSAGWGLRYVPDEIGGITKNCISILSGFALTYQLFLAKVPEMDYQVLNTWWMSLIVIILILIIIYVGPRFAILSGSFYAKNIGQHNLANRFFGYFGWYGHDKEVALDARMYRQEDICNPYMYNKESTFGSKGAFAGYARGMMGVYRVLSITTTTLLTGIIYLFVGLKAWAGAFGIGLVTQYVGAISNVSTALSELIQSMGGLRNNAKFLEMLYEYLDIPNEMYQGSLTIEKRRDRKYEIEFRNVSFMYPGAKTYALQGVNMKFNIGERVAVVGQNGSGKTTFIKLLCRLYDPTEGEILLNGIDTKKYNYQEYMSIFSVVFQDFRLFAYSLGANIGVGNDYDTEKAYSALMKAGFHNLEDKFKDGLDTHLYKNISKDGIEISGGEAQKIALARALYKESSFMILDEPTAALDPIAEQEVYSSFNSIIEDKTAVYISHRLSSCKFCDTILVFDEGNVIQQGTHELLIKESGKYKELWSAQAKYYLEEVAV